MIRIRVAFEGITGSPYLATHYFAGTAAVNGTAALAAVRDFWNALEPAMTDELTWTTEPDVVDMTESGVITGSTTFGTFTGVGTATSEMGPRAAQGLIRWRTGLYVGGREIRGRTFVPGSTEGMNASGFVAAGTIAVMNSAALLLSSAPGCELVVWSRKNATSVPVTSGDAWNNWAMLTSRRD